MLLSYTPLSPLPNSNWKYDSASDNSRGKYQVALLLNWVHEITLDDTLDNPAAHICSVQRKCKSIKSFGICWEGCEIPSVILKINRHKWGKFTETSSGLLGLNSNAMWYTEKSWKFGKNKENFLSLILLWINRKHLVEYYLSKAEKSINAQTNEWTH